MSEAAAKRVKSAEYTTMREIGHFPMSENPVTFKKYLMPVLQKILGKAAKRKD
jgi:pimeloyl-ACP methyl ester carboxylesterase